MRQPRGGRLAGDSPVQVGGGPLAGFAPGSRVAGYVLEQLAGVGGMAAVYRARDERLGRVVALKLLAGDESLRSRFVREARAVAAVDHPHIIPVYAAGEADGVQYIAMRFVAGDTLQGIIHREGSLPPRRVARYISPVASALDAAHAAGLVHRDVKPGNILVDTGPGRPRHVYLTDFGIARAIESAATLTVAGQFLGTPDYASPEQIYGQPVDGRADQYALGCVACQLLTGVVPFKRDSAMAVLYAHTSAPPPKLTALRPDLPAAVDEVLARALAKEPEERYSSCGAFADALREALGVEPYDPDRTTPPASAVRPPSAMPGTEILTPTETVNLTSPEAVAQIPSGTAAVASAGAWSAVVTADRAYYDSVRAANDEDTESMAFPGDLPERHFPLDGTEFRIGRRSPSRGVPDIDLTGDPGISRQHAMLTVASDGTWTVTDLDSPNGIQVNGKDIPSGGQVALRPGDHIHLGAWTRITITRT
jgi:serine/threonine protein kinase